MSLGWITLHRALCDHWVWDCEFSTGQAWVDLLLKACHSQNKFMIKGQLVNLTRGQQARSEVTLSKEWKWSRNKVRRFLKNLEKDGMIEQKTTHLTSIITICNYDSFQSKVTASETPKGQLAEHVQDISRNTNNNVNNENNENKTEVPAKKSPSKKKKTSFPDDFCITQEMYDWFVEKEFSIDIEQATEAWAIAIQSKGLMYVNWKMAWMTGMRNANDWRKK